MLEPRSRLEIFELRTLWRAGSINNSEAPRGPCAIAGARKPRLRAGRQAFSTYGPSQLPLKKKRKRAESMIAINPAPPIALLQLQKHQTSPWALDELVARAIKKKDRAGAEGLSHQHRRGLAHVGVDAIPQKLTSNHVKRTWASAWALTRGAKRPTRKKNR